MTDHDPEVIKLVRKYYTNMMAKDLCSVQPMSTKDVAEYLTFLSPVPWWKKPFTRRYWYRVVAWIKCRTNVEHTRMHTFGRGWVCWVCRKSL